jgi:hypothetical protein
MKLTGENRSTRGKNCSSATLSTTNPTWTDPGSNPSLRGERPATNRLSRGAAYPLCTIMRLKVGSVGATVPEKYSATLTRRDEKDDKKGN